MFAVFKYKIMFANPINNICYNNVPRKCQLGCANIYSKR